MITLYKNNEKLNNFFTLINRVFAEIRRVFAEININSQVVDLY
jgi:hypothetical protein